MKAFSNISKTCLLPLFFLAAALFSPSFTYAGDGTKQAEKINKEAKDYAEDVENSGAKKAITEDFADAVKKLGEDNPDDADAVKKGACEKLDELIKKHKNNKEIQKILRQFKKHLRLLKLIDCGDDEVQGGNPNDVGMNANTGGTLVQAGGGGGGTASSVDYFLKLEGVDGEATSAGGEKWIELNSVQLGALSPNNFGHGSGGGAGKVSMQDFHFVAKVAKATPKLLQACANGTHFPSAIIVCRKAGSDQQTYMQYELENCMVTSYQIGGGSSSSSDRPMESISINFTKVEFSQIQQGEKRVIYQGGR